MKKSTHRFSLFISLAMFSMASAHAFDGKIEFNGAVAGQTCTINGGTGQNFTVNMPTVHTVSLSAAGSSSGRTAFKIDLTNCVPETGSVYTFFEPGSTVNPSTNQLIADAGGANNVEIRLLNDDFSKILAGGAASQNSKQVSINAGAATLNYFSEYNSPNGGATAGQVTSRVNYTLVYQ